MGRDEVLGWPGEDGGVGGAGLGVVFARDVEGEREERVGLGCEEGGEAIGERGQLGCLKGWGDDRLSTRLCLLCLYDW